MTLKERIEKATNEARELAEQWTGTLHEEIINQELNNLVEAMHERGEDNVVSQLESLENTLTKARDELERSENEG